MFFTYFDTKPAIYRDGESDYMPPTSARLVEYVESSTYAGDNFVFLLFTRGIIDSLK